MCHHSRYHSHSCNTDAWAHGFCLLVLHATSPTVSHRPRAALDFVRHDHEEASTLPGAGHVMHLCQPGSTVAVVTSMVIRLMVFSKSSSASGPAGPTQDAEVSTPTCGGPAQPHLVRMSCSCACMQCLCLQTFSMCGLPTPGVVEATHRSTRACSRPGHQTLWHSHHASKWHMLSQVQTKALALSQCLTPGDDLSRPTGLATTIALYKIQPGRFQAHRPLQTVNSSDCSFDLCVVAERSGQ